MQRLRLLLKKHFEEPLVIMCSLKTHLNLCLNKGGGSIIAKGCNALIKIKSSGIFANDVSSFANEEADYFITIKIVSLSLNYIVLSTLILFSMIFILLLLYKGFFPLKRL